MAQITLYRLGRISNRWVTDGMSEVLSTFVLALFVYASGAQYVLTYGASSSIPARALTAGCGLALSVYCGFNASGSCVNPCIALMFCLTGKLQWRRYFWYVTCEFTGAFIAAALTYGVYADLIEQYDGGIRSVTGSNATAHIFTSFPRESISKQTGFFDIVVGSGLLTSLTCMIIDQNNAGTTNGVIPIALVFMLFGIIMSFGVNTGAAINLSIDLSGRIFAFSVGYGSEVFSHADYWFWVPPVACVTGTLTFVSIYQLMVGNHLVQEKQAPAEDILKSQCTCINTDTFSTATSDSSINKEEKENDIKAMPGDYIYKF